MNDLRTHPLCCDRRVRQGLSLAAVSALFALILAGLVEAAAPKPQPKPATLAVDPGLVSGAQAAPSAALQDASPALSAPPKPVVKPGYVAVLDPRHDRLVYLPASLRATWQAYDAYRDIKAFAVSVSGLNARPVAAFSVAHKDVAGAIDGAITACEATAQELGRPTDCEIFAIGDYVVFGAEPGYDRMVMQTMESLTSTGRAGRSAKGQITKL
jgi:hypothetical protein